MNTKKVLLVDANKCNGCKMCEVVCSLEHIGSCNPACSRIKILKNEERGVDLPVVCMHCTEPACVEVCPTGAMVSNKDLGGITVKEDTCLGCKLCLMVCPIGAITINPIESRGPILKCDLCGGDPQCVKFCEPGALSYCSVSESNSNLAKKVLDAFLKSTT